MLEVFYEKTTKILTAWRSEGRQGSRLLLNGEAKVMIDMVAPAGTARDYILDDGKLKLSLSYVLPKTPRDLATEIDELKERVEKMVNK